MKISYKIVNNLEGQHEMCRYFNNHSWVGFDIETTDLDPFNGEIRLIQLSDKDTTYVVDIRECTDLSPLCGLLAAGHIRKVAHNAKFDAKWVKHHLKTEVNGLFCTYIASNLLACGDVVSADTKHPHSGHRLADVSERYLGIILDKTQQTSDWSAEILDPEQIEYAAKDARIMVPLMEKMWQELEAAELLQVAELENACIVPIATMELNGFRLDSKAWLDQLDEVKVQHEWTGKALTEQLGKHSPQPSLLGVYDINLDSPPMISDYLKWAGVPIKDSTEEWKLQPLAAAYPVVGTLLDYRGLSKAMTSYGDSWLDHIRPSTGRIHAEFDQIRAKTGRFGCSKPNLQQIPAESQYRWCFKPAPGNKLVIADYSQIELRILADRSGDTKFIAAFNSGVDLHTATAAQVFNLEIADVSLDQRSFAKRLNFGLVYGISASRFAALTGMTREEAETIMSLYFTTFSGVNMYIRDTGRQAVVDRMCRTGSGRMMRLRFDDSSCGAIGGAKRLGVNMPIQGTSADILKRALRLLHDRLLGSSSRLVNIVHDEIVVECMEADTEWTALQVEEAMVAAGQEFISQVPVKVDVKVDDMWRK